MSMLRSWGGSTHHVCPVSCDSVIWCLAEAADREPAPEAEDRHTGESECSRHCSLLFISTLTTPLCLLIYHASPPHDGVLSFTNWAVSRKSSNDTINPGWCSPVNFLIIEKSGRYKQEPDMDFQLSWWWCVCMCVRVCVRMCGSSNFLQRIFQIHQTPLTDAKTVMSLLGMWKWLLDSSQADTKHCMPSCTFCISVHLFRVFPMGTSAAWGLLWIERVSAQPRTPAEERWSNWGCNLKPARGCCLCHVTPRIF